METELEVVALGGNALGTGVRSLDAEALRERIARAVRPLAETAGGRSLVLTHGNGPQIGALSLAQDGQTLDVLGAESQGLIGYLLEQELRHRVGGEVATVLTSRFLPFVSGRRTFR